MGRRLNVSQSMVIDTILTPLTDFLEIQASDTLEQWYDVSAPVSSQFSPNREETPLVLTPVVQAYDPDSGTKYVVTTFDVSEIHWYKAQKSGGQYTETEITSTSSSDYFYRSGMTLVVRQNISSENAITIRCQLDYVDPRSTNEKIRIMSSVLLTANQDATAFLPVITVLAEKNTPFNPLNGGSSQITFVANAMIESTDVTSDVYFQWYATDENHTTETLINTTTTTDGVNIPTFPCYVSGQGTNSLTVDAMYAEKINIICRAKANSQSATPLYPSKYYLTLSWNIPKIESITYTNNGAAVNKASGEKTFGQIVNSNGETLSEQTVRGNFVFGWYKYRTSVLSAQSPSATLAGYGYELTLPPSDLVNQKNNGSMPSTVVYADVYLLGAYEVVTVSGTPVTVTIGGVSQPVFARI